MDESAENWGSLTVQLYEDIGRCWRMVQDEDSQFARRCYVRAAFAFVEGYFYELRQSVLGWRIDSLRANPDQEIPIHEIALLRDESPRIESNGKINFERSRQSSMNYFAFILRMAAELQNFDAIELFGDNGWKELRLAMDIRHRITHPKSLKSIQISDDDIHKVGNSIHWIYITLLKLTLALCKSYSAQENPIHTDEPSDQSQGE